MSPYSGSKCSEEEELDLFYLEIEERILLLISEEDEEDGAKKTEVKDSVNKAQLQPTKQHGGGYYYHGSENIGKRNELWIHEYGAVRYIRSNRMNEISGRKGTGVFIPKSLVHSC